MSRRYRTKKQKHSKSKTKVKRNIKLNVSEHEKKLIEALRTMEDLKDFNAYHFGDEFVSEKLKKYGANFGENYKDVFVNSKVFTNSKFHKETLDKDGNLIIEDDNGTRIIPPPKIVNSKSQFKDFEQKMRQHGTQHSYSKRIKDDGTVRKIYINENGKETVYSEPSKFKTNKLDNESLRTFLNSESSFKTHKTNKSKSYSREEHNDGNTLTITEIIDGEKRVSVKPSKLKKIKRNRQKRNRTRRN